MRNAYLQRRGYFDLLVGSFTKASTVGDEWRDCVYHVSFLYPFPRDRTGRTGEIETGTGRTGRVEGTGRKEEIREM